MAAMLVYRNNANDTNKFSFVLYHHSQGFHWQKLNQRLLERFWKRLLGPGFDKEELNLLSSWKCTYTTALNEWRYVFVVLREGDTMCWVWEEQARQRGRRPLGKRKNRVEVVWHFWKGLDIMDYSFPLVHVIDLYKLHSFKGNKTYITSFALNKTYSRMSGKTRAQGLMEVPQYHAHRGRLKIATWERGSYNEIPRNSYQQLANFLGQWGSCCKR